MAHTLSHIVLIFRLADFWLSQTDYKRSIFFQTIYANCSCVTSSSNQTDADVSQVTSYATVGACASSCKSLIPFTVLLVVFAIALSAAPICRLFVTVRSVTHTSMHSKNSCPSVPFLGTVTARWLDSDSVVTIARCRQHVDWATNGSAPCCRQLITMTTLSLSSHHVVTVPGRLLIESLCLVGYWWNLWGVLLCISISIYAL